MMSTGHLNSVENGVTSDLARICLQHQFADVVFIVGQQQQRIPAHRAILAARCDVFAAMLFGGMREAVIGHEVCVPDVPPDAFRNVMWFLYTGECTVNTDSGM